MTGFSPEFSSGFSPGFSPGFFPQLNWAPGWTGDDLVLLCLPAAIPCLNHFPVGIHQSKSVPRSTVSLLSLFRRRRRSTASLSAACVPGVVVVSSLVVRGTEQFSIWKNVWNLNRSPSACTTLCQERLTLVERVNYPKVCFASWSPLLSVISLARYINTRIVAQEHRGLLAFAAFAPLSVPLPPPSRTRPRPPARVTD